MTPRGGAADSLGDVSVEDIGVQVRQFRTLLLRWYGREARPLPWRATRDPYAILVSEIMLQQTQATRVEPAYRAFLQRFPRVTDLAAASLADVLTAWRGLGYNRRARNLHLAAMAIVAEHGGSVPADLQALRALPGIGDYTARALLTFGFGLAAGPVDTNIGRVLARAIVGAPLSRSQVQHLADRLAIGAAGDLQPVSDETPLPATGLAAEPATGLAAEPAAGHSHAAPGLREAEPAATWNHALMDLGARVCTARGPRCHSCPVASACTWRAAGGPQGEDPAAASGVRPRPQGAFAGSDRYHRGRLIDALRQGPITRARLPVAAGLPDGERLDRLIGRLQDDGLVEWRGGILWLPGGPDAS
jgi:A/G-specific adenine glycosylase